MLSRDDKQALARQLLHRQLNLPPDTDSIYLAWDDKGQPWLLKYGCFGAEDEWTALGFDERGIPAVVPIGGQISKRYLLSPPIKIRRWVAVGEI